MGLTPFGLLPFGLLPPSAPTPGSPSAGRRRENSIVTELRQIVSPRCFSPASRVSNQFFGRPCPAVCSSGGSPTVPTGVSSVGLRRTLCLVLTWHQTRPPSASHVSNQPSGKGGAPGGSSQERGPSPRGRGTPASDTLRSSARRACFSSLSLRFSSRICCFAAALSGPAGLMQLPTSPASVHFGRGLPKFASLSSCSATRLGWRQSMLASSLGAAFSPARLKGVSAQTCPAEVWPPKPVCSTRS
eukprot:scaffold82464_cov66-Phaeocystis_antarctica.AAC.9